MPPTPIFIVGCPRSGTTLLRRLLDRHPALAICPETQFQLLVHLRRRSFGDLGSPAKRARLIREYLASRPMRDSGMDPAELAQRLSRDATSYQALFTSILNYYADSTNKPRYGEKTALHALFLGTLLEWFPGAVILHVMRDPRAAVASLQRAPWASSSVVTNACKWLKLNRAARRFCDRPGYLEVRYEELVSNPPAQLQKICSFLGEEFSSQMLVPDHSRMAGRDDAKRWQTAISSERLNIWKEELTKAQVAQIEWVLGSEMESFGYERSAPSASAITVLRGFTGAALDYAVHLAARLPPFLWYRLAERTKIEKSDYYWRPKDYFG